MIYRSYLFRKKLPLYNSALDAYALRQRTIAKNITNATSPHYRPEAVNFEEQFQNSMMSTNGTTTDELHIPIGKSNANDVMPEVEEAPVPKAEIYFSGETHVNIDKEMSQLAQNQIRFRFASKMVGKYFKGLTSAITGYRE